MKKIFYLASIAALALSSCTKDETTEAALAPVNNGSKIVAAMEADDTRTALVKNGNAYDIVWKSTDGLSVYEKGSNGVVTDFKNRLFQLDNASDGVASGAFTGSKLTAGGTYLAVYPYDKAYDFKPNWNATYYKPTNSVYPVLMLDPTSVEVNIPGVQEYVGSGTFNTNTIPAVSTSFVVGEDGNATVKMQPVVDYVMVDIVATEPIKNITLRLYEGTPSDATAIDIAGTAALQAYYANGGIRYTTFLNGDELSSATDNTLDQDYITLVTKDLADDVSLAKANTYVFAVPGGILGMNKNINWGLFIHKNDTPDFNKDKFVLSTATPDDPNYYYINGMINQIPISSTKSMSRVHNDSADNSTTITKHKENGVKTEIDEYAMNLENTVFYLNASDAEGNVQPFTYNPGGDKLIRNELDLLDYFYNYNTGYGDAYVAEGATFNLSVDNLSEILRNKKNIDAGLRTAINDYIMPDGVFPVIENYSSQFIGNGAVISNIERPLADMNGLFGNIAGDSKDEPAFVQNITLANVVAATEKGDDGKVVKGNVLAGNIGEHASIAKIAVSKLNADAVVGEASLGNFTAISVAEGGSVNKDLNHIVATVELNNDYKPKAEVWTALSAVGEGVFNTIVPVERTVTGSTPDKHHIITLPAGDYEDLTEEFVNMGDERDDDLVASAVASLLIGEVSHWTGGYKDTYSTANSNKFYYGNALGAYLNYAEELANGFDVDGSIIAYALSRDMNFENNDLTKQINFGEATLSGAGNTVTGLTYVVNEDNWSAEAADNDVAPFNLDNIEDIVFDGLNVSIETTNNTVPRLISGISNYLKNVDGVTINNLVIDAYSEGSNNTVTDANYDKGAKGQRHVGWLSAAAMDIAVYDTTVNGVDSNVIALSAMVSWIDVQTNNSIFDGSKVTGKIVKAKDQVDIKEFTRYNANDVQYNLMGSLVGMVENGLKTATNVGVKFNDYGSVKPVSLFKVATNGSAINILYNNKLAVSLYHKDDKRNE